MRITNLRDKHNSEDESVRNNALRITEFFYPSLKSGHRIEIFLPDFDQQYN